MHLSKVLLLSFIIFKTVIQVGCFIDPFSLSATVIVSTLYYLSKSDNHKTAHEAYKYIGRQIGYFEGCEDYWIPENLAGLRQDLKENVFGQPVALDMVLSSLQQHLNKRNPPERPLVLSFHGSPGTGKNFISQKIFDHMFRKGDKTDFKYFFKSSIDFPLKSETGKYKKFIIDKVKEKNYECRRSIFVFDEVEKMPDGILDVLRGIVSAGHNEDYDFRKSIFILLSNIGIAELYNEALYHWENNIDRTELDVKKMSNLISKTAFNDNGGLKHSGLIKSYTITHYVPFLPLERSHVIQCLEKEVARQGQVMSSELVEQVLEELSFIPENSKLFSTGGCKGVGEKAGMFFQRELRRRNRGRQQ